MRLFIILNLLVTMFTCFAQETVTDYDGNVYNIIAIGNQVWLKENLKSLHYTDGTEIPDVAVYGDDEGMADIYGRLYTWDATMRNSTEEGVQGIAPDGWHIPSDTEWIELENFLGGASIAGGKMKTAGTEHWSSPNTGADNSSGFSGLPAGEFDAHYSPNIFQLLNTHAVFWTSTEVNSTKARERYLSYDNKACSQYDWYKEMKYSIRCIRNAPTNVEEEDAIYDFGLKQNYPNPFNPISKIDFVIPSGVEGSTYIKDLQRILGKEIATLVNESKATWNL
jgi:uncharacterized protein (TIGR02145 family)